VAVNGAVWQSKWDQRGQLANSVSTTLPTQQPSNSKLEAAYHKADAAIQNIVDLLAAARCYRSVFLFKIFELRFYPTLSGRR
jgi:hypothetical protein